MLQIIFLEIQQKCSRTFDRRYTRSDGLQKYLRFENKKGKDFFGGILINVNSIWMYYDKPKYAYDPNDHSKWEILEIQTLGIIFIQVLLAINLRESCFSLTILLDTFTEYYPSVNLKRMFLSKFRNFI